MKNAKCPSCKKIIQFQDKVKIQELVECPLCNSILELVKKFPLTLDWADDPAVQQSQRAYSKKI